MKLKCNEVVYSMFKDILFTQDNTYEFMPVDNRFTKINNYIGYFLKDDEGFKRWSSKEFKDLYFEEYKNIINKEILNYE